MDEVFAALKAILAPYGKRLDVKHDEPGNYYVDMHHLMKNKKPLFFGAAQTKKSYVSFHLMPVYLNSDLLDGLSPELKKRMQGKSCFNFKAVDKALFAELAKLTEKGFEDYRRQGFVK